MACRNASEKRKKIASVSGMKRTNFFSLSVTQPLAVRFGKRVRFTHIFLVTLKHFVSKSSVSVSSNSRTADEALRTYAWYKG